MVALRGAAHILRRTSLLGDRERGAPSRSRRGRATRAGLAVALALASVAGLKAAGAAALVFAVNSTADAIDAHVGDGACATSAGTCTLRAAIQEANARPGADVIQVPAGTYAIAIPARNQNDITSGDLDVTDSVTISGAGAASTIVDAGTPPSGAPPESDGLDRLFEILVDGGEVSFSGLTLSDGYASEYGGAIMNSSTATVTVTASTLSGNVAGKTGGAIDNHVGGAVDVRDSTLSGNYAGESGSAVNNNRDGLLTIANSTVSTNSAAVIGRDPALVGAGAISNNAELDAKGKIAVTGSQISDNRSGGGRSGAGISNDGTGILTVDQTTFSKNDADADAGAIFNGAGEVTVTNSTFSENAAGDGGAIASTGGTTTVLASTFSKNSADGLGGAMRNGNQGAVTIRNSTFSENSALGGGGFSNEGTGLVTVESSAFTKNVAIVTAVLASGEGGGMHSNSGGEVVIAGGSFTENKARGGGGLSNEGGGQATITGTRFSANHAEAEGGGILVQSGAVRMVNIDVVGNVSSSALEGGGGISYHGDKAMAVGESAAIVNSRIRDNKSGGEGGGIDSRGDGLLAITTTVVTGNTSAVGGGIHHVGDAPLAVARSTLSGNAAGNGGGVFTDGDGEAILENTTVSGNRANEFGGGVLVSSRLTVRNSTVTNNLAASGGGINNGGGDLIGDGLVFLANTIVAKNPAGGNCAGTITSRGGNVENSNTCQLKELSDQPGTDPLLGALANNGGPTQTHALLAGSLAQEKAACTELDPCPPVDQRGVERPQFEGVDAGAYESELTPGGGGTPQCAGLIERPVSADYDSWVSQSSSATNLGTDAILDVTSRSGGNERALVHFTLPPIPPGCKLVGATLRLHSSSATEGRTLEALRLASGWSELGVTWANQPATAGTPAPTPSGLGVREWNVLEQARDMYALGGHGFLIRDAAENGSGGQSFHSREKGAEGPPELVLVFDDPDSPPPPESCPKVPQIFFADRDSWVSQSSPSNNFGSDSSLKVKSQVGSNSRALVRFSLPILPSGCTTVASATLRLNAGSAKEGRTLEVLQIGSAWSETGVTWSNQPSATGPAAATASAQGTLEWTVTTQLLGMYTFANHGFLIRDAAENGVGDEQALNSREKGTNDPPELVLVFDDSTPETTIDDGPVSPIDDTAATFTFSSDRDDATFECSLDGAAFQTCTSPHAVQGLTEGSHGFQVRATRRVRAVDPTPASHHWTIAIPPETSVAGPASPSTSPNATLSFTADDPDATFECSLNAAPFAACTSPVEYTNLADGPQEVRVRAVDPFGNADPSPAAHVWTVAVPPQTTIDDQPVDPSKSSAAGFAFSGSDNGTVPSRLVFECRLDAGEWAACTSPQGYEALSDGAHSFEVRATDEAGNTDPEPASYVWTVDTVAPATTIESGPPDPSNDDSPSFQFSSGEEGSSFECRLDAGAWVACASPQSYSALADGAHSFQVRATDRAGNTDGTAAAYGWTIDTVAPQTAIDSGPASPTRSTDASFAFSAGEDGSFECRLDAGAWVSCSTPQAYSELADGAHTFEVRATDRAGNTDASPANHTWTVDTVAPQTTITSAPSNPNNDDSPSFEFASGEDGSSFECQLDAGAWVSCSSPQGYSALADAAHSFQVRATDRAGNTDGSAAVHDWTIDTIAPQTTIESGPASPTRSTDTTFVFSAGEDGSRFECRLDAGAWVACASPQSYNALADGAHSFQVRATDRAGNTDGTAAAYGWTVDTIAPQTAIDSGPASPTRSTDASFVFSAGEDGSFECRLDAGGWVSCSSPQAYSALADGAHSFQVRATDEAANTDPDPASYVWTVDTVAPQTAIDSGPASPTRTTDASFAFSADEDSSFECRLDAGPWVACSSPQAYAALADGTHSFQVRATDGAGNTDGTAAAHGWTVDTVAPQTAIESAPATPTRSTSASFAFSASEDSSFECKLDAGAWVSCSSPQAYSALADGAHSLQVGATDRAGNVDSTPAVHSWTVDTAAPETTIDSGPTDPSPDREAEFEFSSSEAGSSFECQLDAGAWVSCSSPQAYSALADGAHTFRVRATDPAGNVDPDPAIYGWTVEEPNTTPPDTTITSAPPALTSSTSASFAFSSSETGSTFECSLDDAAAFTACSSPRAYSGLAAGAHTFRVRAIDAAGNVDGSPASHSWTVDTAAPETTITEAPPALTASTSASFAFSSSETGLTFECSLDNAVFTACSSPRQYAGLSSGGHGFRVRAKDPAGNTDPTPASYAWTVDSMPPETSIDSGPPASTTSTGATFTFSASESGSTFECSLDGAAFAACVSPREYTALAAGGHEFRARAKDAAGNVDASPASHSWTIQASGGCVGSSTATAAANADSWVLQSSSSSNYGNDSVVKVDSKAGANARALFRFALPAIPAGCQVTDARLRLYASSYKPGRTMQALRLGANWTESGVTWSNQPLTAGAAATTMSPSTASYVQWKVTLQVESMYSSGNHGFLIRDSVENGNGIEQAFHSREKAPDNPPQLVISFG
jgi:CSLREA domain-containing protein